jgi:predicted O-methyltransferase YrrM
MRINNKDYSSSSNEFNEIKLEGYEDLRILPNVTFLERHIGLLNDIREDLNLNSILIIGVGSKASFVSDNCSYKNITISDEIVKADVVYILDNVLITSEMYKELKKVCNNSIILSPKNPLFNYLKNVSYSLSDINPYEGINFVNYHLYIPENYLEKFYDNFSYYIKNNVFHYDNLINICIMVKDAGDLFEKVLTENLPYIDRWTILDTGSTDNTIEIINKVLCKKKGKLYQEPFINFRDSRNRCLELAGTKCKYNIMLDDTYILRGNLRNYLSAIRGDQYADSYNLVITCDELEYYSNRVLKSERNLKYYYKIHEVIEANTNVVIPKDQAYIQDNGSEYMYKRTLARKEKDLELLFEEMNDNPEDCRMYYYIGQTYSILKKYELAAEYYLKRFEMEKETFFNEKVDALFEAARIYESHLNKPWEECEKMYLKCFELDGTRAEYIYYVGAHYYEKDRDHVKAYKYLKKAFDLGFPSTSSFNIRPFVYNYYLPKLLAEICYYIRDYKTGLEACKFFLTKNKPNIPSYSAISCWYDIYECMLKVKLNGMPHNYYSKNRIFCFVADGGYNKWSGKDIYEKGVGGSETYIIELSRYIKKHTDYRVIVFCNCEQKEIFENVEYEPLENFISFVSNNIVETCVVSRYSKYIPVCVNTHVRDIYFVLHDILPIGELVPIDPKLKKILCLSEWHKQYFLEKYPHYSNITEVFSYGIDPKYMIETNEKSRSFIYSSFPNRGLSTLLKMWPEIKKTFPSSTLDIYCDIYGEWVTSNHKEEMKEIKNMIWDNEGKIKDESVVYHGWVSKEKLREAWRKSYVWFYPCKFTETFCLTALEAAASKTLVISNDLAALKETAKRGIIIPGDSKTKEWQDKALETMRNLFYNEKDKIDDSIRLNYEFVKEMTWESRAVDFLNRFKFSNIEIYDKRLNYLEMYNWSNDIPVNTKQIFNRVLDMINKNSKNVYILEIGTYTGTSVIEMLKRLPESYATVIDPWEDYKENVNNKNIGILENMKKNNVENIFYENIKAVGVENRVEVLKGDSTKILSNLIGNRLFDFIYVDGSHLCLDCYSDMILAWKLLRKGGVMGVDDYLYKIDDKDVLGKPFYAVEHFMDKYKNEIRVIDKGYRVFVEKI